MGLHRRDGHDHGGGDDAVRNGRLRRLERRVADEQRADDRGLSCRQGHRRLCGQEGSSRVDALRGGPRCQDTTPRTHSGSVSRGRGCVIRTVVAPAGSSVCVCEPRSRPPSWAASTHSEGGPASDMRTYVGNVCGSATNHADLGYTDRGIRTWFREDGSSLELGLALVRDRRRKSRAMRANQTQSTTPEKAETASPTVGR